MSVSIPAELGAQILRELKWFAQGQIAVRFKAWTLILMAPKPSSAQQSTFPITWEPLSHSTLLPSPIRCSKHCSSPVTLMDLWAMSWLPHLLYPPCGLQKFCPALLFQVLCKFPGCGRESKFLTVFSCGHPRNTCVDSLGRSEPHLQEIETLGLGGRCLHP